MFALLANGTLLAQKLRSDSFSTLSFRKERVDRLAGPGEVVLPGEVSSAEPRRVWTIGGLVSHLGAAVFLIGLVCLVTFVKQDKDRLLVKDLPTPVLNGAYTVTYLGQTGDYRTDRDNLLRFRVSSKDGRDSFLTTMPYALRTMEGGGSQLVAHPSISHHLGGDLYLALNRGPDEFYVRGHDPVTLPLGAAQTWGPYTLQFLKFERDPLGRRPIAGDRDDAHHQVSRSGPTYASCTGQVLTTSSGRRASDTLNDPQEPVSPEITLPGGALLSFVSMNAGDMAVNSPAGGESGSFVLREPGPVMESFEVDATTRPMINFIWLGTLLIFGGGLLSMRRRVLENRAAPIPDFPGTARPTGARPRAKRRLPVGKPAPSLMTMRGERH